MNDDEYQRRQAVVKKLARAFSVDELELLMGAFDPPAAPEVVSIDSHALVGRAEALLLEIANNRAILMSHDQRYVLGWLTGTITRHDVRAVIEDRAKAVHVRDAVPGKMLLTLIRLHRNGDREMMSFTPGEVADSIRDWWRR